MSLFQKPNPLTDNVERFVAQALSYNGYTASANRINVFGERLGMNGLPWDGIFIDVVAREVGVSLPSHIYPPVALADYMGSGLFRAKPRRGDIVFFATSEVMDFGSPHVGIVTDASRHGIDGTFATVEAMVGNGKPKSPQNGDGVHVRVRHQTEVIGYARPRFISLKEQRTPLEGKVPHVVPAQLRNGLRHKNVEVVQLALADLFTDVRGLPRGHFDTRTRLAYAKFQRSIGYPPSRATGDVDGASLQRLAEMTGLFTASA
jgi:hypothetical protein